MRELRCGAGVWAALLILCASTTARAEGTAQLGANQDLVESTVLKVDVTTVGEVINIAVGNDSATDTTAVEVTVLDPSGVAVAGSPFSVTPGAPGHLATPDQLPPATITNPLQIVTAVVGTYSVTFDNKRTDLASGYEQVVDPFDITVTPNASTPVQPTSPPGGQGRVHSNRWRINAHKFTSDAASNAAFYVLTPTGPTTDHTWLLKFNGLAGFYFDVAGNDVGMPAPNSGFSIEELTQPTGTSCVAGYQYSAGPPPVCVATPPTAKYEIYVNVPKLATGGGAVPQITNFAFAGPTALCGCAVQTLKSTFTFTSDRDGTYQLVLDTNKDGKYDPGSGDVLLAGNALTGTNKVEWDGTDNSGTPVPVGSYNARLSVRTGEFHFVGRDIETANPGLRIFSVNPPQPATTPAAAQMYWNDSKINSTTLKVDPVSTLPDGLSSGSFTDTPVCSKPGATSVNAHCWGNFTADPTLSPGDQRYIDTWVFFQEAVSLTVACVVDGASDDDSDSLTLLQECSTTQTDPTKGDTDGDGILDGIEVGGTNPTDPTKGDTDGDGILDGIEDKNHDGKVDIDETDPNDKDSDNDGLEDGIEDENKDGVVDVGETDPTRGDTDGDGILDGTEDVNKNGQPDGGESDPTLKDTDGDGLDDGIEDKNKNGQTDAGETNATLKDTDGDGLDDGVEDANQDGLRDPTETDPTDADTDNDGLKDGQEDANKNGVKDASETDPLVSDTDGDGLTDGIEKGVDQGGNSIAGANPTDALNSDTDGDDLPDGIEDINKNGKREASETDPNKTDTDGDGLGDGLEKGVNPGGSTIIGASVTDPLNEDSDGDGLPDGVEDANKNGIYDKNTANPALGETDPNNKDTDDDDLVDGWIDANSNGTFDPGEGEDRNLDGKRDGDETDPRLADTDGGSEPDGSEVLKTAHDPLDPTDDRPPNVALLGGGGCSLGQGQESAGVGLLLLLVLLLLTVGRRRIAGLLLIASLGLPSAARAAEPIQFSVLSFQPAASTLNYIVTEGGFTLPHLYPSAALYMSYAHRPLELIDTTTDDRVADVIRYQLNMELLLAMGFFDRLELGLALPVTLVQKSDDLAVLDRSPGTSLAGGLGDIRIQPKLRIMTRGPATLALALPFSVPSGKQDAFLGDESVTFSPRAVIAFDTTYFDVALNVGYRLRQDQSRDVSDTQRLAVDDEVFGSAGIRVALWKDHLDLLADGFVSASIYEQDREEVPVEALGGLRYYFPHGIIANAGAGAGVTRGIGAPRFRVYWGLAYQYTPVAAPRPQPVAADPDPDHDSILGDNDKCPTDPEDKDGFEDADGCPDTDNDKDAILDDKDRCPNEPEDRDGFEDEDGCPDTDNDKDGILDENDRCPNEPEDKDGFEDEDGCPDTDNDKDGILDENDRCPNQPEVINGVDDTDGCPDKARGPVQIQHGKITVPPVFFATGKDTILPLSFPVLRMVARTLTDNPWVKKVRIEGHTDSRGNDAFNLDLSQRRATSVMQFLVQNGVDAGRLEAQGFGETRPISTNNTKVGRARNRRVEFIIIDPAQAQSPAP